MNIVVVRPLIAEFIEGSKSFSILVSFLTLMVRCRAVVGRTDGQLSLVFHDPLQSYGRKNNPDNRIHLRHGWNRGMARGAALRWKTGEHRVIAAF